MTVKMVWSSKANDQLSKVADKAKLRESIIEWIDAVSKLSKDQSSSVIFNLKGSKFEGSTKRDQKSSASYEVKYSYKKKDDKCEIKSIEYVNTIEENLQEVGLN